jgi:hypothetical protein
MDFVGVFGLLLLIITGITYVAGLQLKVENSNCSEDVNAVKNNKRNIIIMLITGGICIVSWIIYRLVI